MRGFLTLSVFFSCKLLFCGGCLIGIYFVLDCGNNSREKFCICLLLGLKSSTGLWSAFSLNEDASFLCDAWVNGKSSKFHPVPCPPRPPAPPCRLYVTFLTVGEELRTCSSLVAAPPASCSAGHRCLSFLLLTVGNQSQRIPVLHACTSVSPAWAQPQSLCLTPLALTDFLFCFGATAHLKCGVVIII